MSTLFILVDCIYVLLSIGLIYLILFILFLLWTLFVVVLATLYLAGRSCFSLVMQPVPKRLPLAIYDNIYLLLLCFTRFCLPVFILSFKVCSLEIVGSPLRGRGLAIICFMTRCLVSTQCGLFYYSFYNFLNMPFGVS